MGCDLDFSLQLDIGFQKLSAVNYIKYFLLQTFYRYNYFIAAYWLEKIQKKNQHSDEHVSKGRTVGHSQARIP